MFPAFYSCLIGLGLGSSCVFPFCRPPRSLLGHGLGYRAAKLGHGTVGFSCSFHYRPADALLSPEPGGRPGQSGYSYCCGTGLRVILFYFLLCMVFCLLLVERFRLGTAPPRGTAGCATFPFRGSFRLCSSRPPRHAGGLREGFDAVFPYHVAGVFLQSPFFVSPPRHAGGPREFFYGGLPYHGACVFLQLLFFAFFLAS